MSYLFYRWEKGDPPVIGDVPEYVVVSLWQPSRDGLPKGHNRGDSSLLWWLIDRLGGFATRDFAELTLSHGGKPLHQLIVTPKWYRFPDMAAGDLQLGALWTEPAARGQGLARMAIAEAHRRFAGRFRRMWYIVERDNDASIRVIEACGYRLVGKGMRTRPWGIGALGRFMLTTEMAATDPD